MIVFTATHNVTNEVYVGSAKDSMEEQWARLIVQAEEGGSGEFLAELRESGAEAFTVETWAYADSPAESRELVRDACDEFNAKLIKTGRAPAPKVETTSVSESNSEAASTLGKDKPSISVTEKQSAPKNNVSAFQTSNSKTQTSKTSDASGKSSSAKRQEQREHGPVTSIDVSAYLANQAQQKEQSEKKAEVVSLRQKDSTKDFDDMKEVMMRIEMKRRQNRASTSTKSKAKTAKGKSSGVGGNTHATPIISKSAPARDKLPDGRVSSAAKEKRIKEAIAQEKMEREAAQAAKAAAEAKEMAEIMARLDQRSKETERIRRRR